MIQDNLLSGITRSASVDFHLQSLHRWLSDPTITEIAINRPGEVWCERQGRWERYELPSFGVQHGLALATAVASWSHQEWGAHCPILSATLPNGCRIQMVMPPACEAYTVSLTIRKPSEVRRSLDDYTASGFFDHIRPLTDDVTPQEERLQHLFKAGQTEEFLRQAVLLGQVMVVAGETGSGKTTLMKSLIDAIPKTERLITIEDVHELTLPHHPNHVHLLYSSAIMKETNPITSSSLLNSCLRMKPDRILLAELRGGEAFDFINGCASGHGGSITSVHAGSCALALERLALMMLHSSESQHLPYPVIQRLVRQVVDVVVHVHINSPWGRHMTEVWYDPMGKRQATNIRKIR